MQNIWTNPSLERSLEKRIISDTKLLNYLNISISDFSNNKREVLVFVNREYNITFYNPIYGTKQSVKGLVQNIWEDKIKIKCLKYKKPIRNEDRMKNNNTCNCIYSENVNIEKYDDYEIYFIPIQNIMDIKYVNNSPNGNTNKKERVKIMILGISATTLKAIIVRLSFFDDNFDEAVKYVDLKVGNIYDISYECPHRQTIYETRAKVVKIEECEDDTINCCNNKHNSFVREQVGFDNSVYVDGDQSYNCCDKDDFIESKPVRKIKITIDTSETFEGRYEELMLDSIRDCSLVESFDDDDSDEKPSEDDKPDTKPDAICCKCAHKTSNCNPCNCKYHKPSEDDDNTCTDTKYIYSYDNKYNVEVTGENVKILSKEGTTSDINLNDLIKFYLGIE